MRSRESLTWCRRPRRGGLHCSDYLLPERIARIHCSPRDVVPDAPASERVVDGFAPRCRVAEKRASGTACPPYRSIIERRRAAKPTTNRLFRNFRVFDALENNAAFGRWRTQTRGADAAQKQLVCDDLVLSSRELFATSDAKIRLRPVVFDVDDVNPALVLARLLAFVYRKLLSRF